MVYNTVLGIVQQAEDAEEITQDVFMKVYQHLHSFKGDASIKTWIYRISVNNALDHTRRRKFSFRELLEGKMGSKEEMPADFHHPGVSISRKEDAAVLFKAINKLPSKQKAAFILQKLEAQSIKEIAAIMETSEKAAESLLSRAGKNMQDYLENYYKNNY